MIFVNRPQGKEEALLQLRGTGIQKREILPEEWEFSVTKSMGDFYYDC